MKQFSPGFKYDFDVMVTSVTANYVDTGPNRVRNPSMNARLFCCHVVYVPLPLAKVKSQEMRICKNKS